MSTPFINEPVAGGFCVDIPMKGGGGIARIHAFDRQHAEQILAALMTAWKTGFEAAQADIRSALGIST